MTVIFASLFLRETNETLGISGKVPGPLFCRWKKQEGIRKKIEKKSVRYFRTVWMVVVVEVEVVTAVRKGREVGVVMC